MEDRDNNTKNTKDEQVELPRHMDAGKFRVGEEMPITFSLVTGELFHGTVRRVK